MPNSAVVSNDRIAWIKISSCYLPLANPISDAKVLTGRQKPMTEIAMLFVEIESVDGHQGLGFSYSKRAGGPGQFAHAKEIAPALLGEDPNDISKAWVKLCAYRNLFTVADQDLGQPFQDAMIKANPAQLVWGSDWPHLRVTPEPDALQLLDTFKRWTADELLAQRILRDNPEALYR